MSRSIQFDPEKPYATMPEEITGYNNDDPMNSIINIKGIGTMSIS